MINARGTFTPLGVSRSSAQVRVAVARALGDFVKVDEYHDTVARELAVVAGTEAAMVTHCAAAAITLAVAASMTGSELVQILRLPESSGLRRLVAIPAAHVVNYGHSILTDIRLAGAEPVVMDVGPDDDGESLEQLLAGGQFSAVLLVISRLISVVPGPNLAQMIRVARQRGVAVIVDAAAQDLRIAEIAALGADVAIFSAQKYLAGPTAGLAVGQRDFVAAMRLQEKGIGRAMKPSKEALAGVRAAVAQRATLDWKVWRARQDRKVDLLLAQVSSIAGLVAYAEADPTGLPFRRICLCLSGRETWDAAVIAETLRNGSPPVWVMDHRAACGELWLELVPLREREVIALASRFQAVLA